MALPFENASFDVVSTGYGLRNVPELKGAIAEIRRVLRPGGILLSLDFDRPPNAIVRAAYLGYLTVVGAALGYVLHRDPDTYRYIPRSITRYPGASAVARMMQDDGFTSAECVRVLGGLMAIHVARKHNPAQATDCDRGLSKCSESPAAHPRRDRTGEKERGGAACSDRRGGA